MVVEGDVRHFSGVGEEGVQLGEGLEEKSTRPMEALVVGEFVGQLGREGLSLAERLVPLLQEAALQG